MKKILFSACDNTYTQRKNREGLAELLRKNNYQVDSFGNLNKKDLKSYSLLVVFNRGEYERIHTLDLNMPIVCSVDMGFSTPYLNSSKEFSAYCSDLKKRSKRNRRSREATILVGIDCYQALLRAIILLNSMPDYHINLIYSGKRDLSGMLCSHMSVYQEEDIDSMLGGTDLIIGSKYLALEGIFNEKPVVVLGDCGLGGVVNSDTVMDMYHTGFVGKTEGYIDEYFPLYSLYQEIEKGLEMSDIELEYLPRKVEKERTMEQEKILRVVSSLC